MARWLDRLDIIIGPLAVLMAGYHIVNVFTLMQGATGHYITHMGSTIGLALLAYAASKDKQLWKRLLALLVLFSTLLSMLYVWLEADRLEQMFAFISNIDVFVGFVLLISVTAAGVLIWGPILPLFAIIFELYFFFGHRIPGVLGHPYIGVKRIISFIDMGTNYGIFGFLAPTSANFIFFFLTIGGLIISFRIIPMFFELGKGLGNITRAGSPFMALIASSLFGMVSGASVANVTFTGSFTIPTMKKGGLSPAYAGAVEAAASTGGQIMPPIMGNTAFIMASFIGVSYFEVMGRAIVPAVLYFAFVGVSTYLATMRLGVSQSKQEVNWLMIFRRLPVFFIPLIVLIVLLSRFSAMYAATFTILVILTIGLAQRDTRPAWTELVAGLRRGIITACEIALLLALIGPVVEVVVNTGLGDKLAMFFVDFAHGFLPLALFITMVVCIVLGMGLPSPAAYILTSLTAVPILLKLGVPLFSAHFFALYFAVFSTLTPPVAVTSLAASRIAEAGWMDTSWGSIRLALIAWVLPFFMVVYPSVVGGVSELSLQNVAVILSFFVVLGVFSCGLFGYCPGIGRLKGYERVVFSAAALAALLFMFGWDSQLLLGVSITLFLGIVIAARFSRKRHPTFPSQG